MKQNRWKSKLLWASLVAQVCAILVMLGVLDAALSEQIQGVFAAVLQLLAILGIVNDPTNKTGW